MAVELSPLFFCLRNSSSILHLLAAFPLPAAALRGSAPSRWRCRLESKLDSRAQAKARRFQAPAARGADTVRAPAEPARLRSTTRLRLASTSQGGLPHPPQPSNPIQGCSSF